MIVSPIPLFAHTGGLHDLAWFLIPIVIGLVVIRVAEKRAAKKTDSGETAEPDD